jgi:16S rRNA G966 N2-methylase RsmD
MLTINARFQSLIPPLSEIERQQLEENIVSDPDGCRDPLVTWKKNILDGHNRYEICTRRKIKFKTIAMDFPDEDAACIWIIRNQFGRRNLTTFARGELALKLEPLLKLKAKVNLSHKVPGKKGNSPLPKSAKVNTRAETAKAAGVSGDTISKTKFILENADEETKQKLRTQPDLKVHRVAKELKEKQQRGERQAKRLEQAKDAPSVERIIVGDFRQHADKIPDGSLSLIFTDPPYDRKADPNLLPALAEFAAAKLADGGSLLCYIGHTHFLDATDALRQHLRFYWIVACVHTGRAVDMREYGINALWKPVLWFVKGTRDNKLDKVTDVMSGGKEKDYHDWQQSESEASYWIDRLCPKDGIVCDPFLGSGTAAAAAEKLGRQWIGFEIDTTTAAIAQGRIAKVTEERKIAA